MLKICYTVLCMTPIRYSFLSIKNYTAAFGKRPPTIAARKSLDRQKSFEKEQTLQSSLTVWAYIGLKEWLNNMPNRLLTLRSLICAAWHHLILRPFSNPYRRRIVSFYSKNKTLPWGQDAKFPHCFA